MIPERILKTPGDVSPELFERLRGFFGPCNYSAKVPEVKRKFTRKYLTDAEKFQI